MSIQARNVTAVATDERNRINIVNLHANVEEISKPGFPSTFRADHASIWNMARMTRPEVADWHFVGLLISLTDKRYEGRIVWVQDTGV